MKVKELMEKPIRAVLYARVSTEDQTENWSLSAQNRAFQELCKQKNWTVLEVYQEPGKSAHTDSIDRRPVFRQLLADCQSRKFDVVVVHSLDRWSRNLGVTLESFKQLSNAGVSFVSMTENIDYTTPEGRLFLAMLGAFAQYYSDSLSKHTTKGLRERALSGLPNGAVPFGYRRDGKEITVEETEAQAVRDLFNMYARGNQSLANLALWFNTHGFKTRAGKDFTLYSVRWLLHNPFLRARSSTRELVDGQHEALVTETLWNRVQEQLAKSRNHSRTVSKSYRTYLLKGLARCVYCGQALWSETSVSGQSRYRERKGTRTCPVGEKSVLCRQLDDQISQVVSSIRLEPAWKDLVLDKINSTQRYHEVVEERRILTDRLRRLTKTFIDGLVNDSDFDLQKKLIQERLDSLVVPEVDAALNAGEFLEDLSVLWGNANLDHDIVCWLLC